MSEIRRLYKKFNDQINEIYSLLDKSISLYDDNEIKYEKELHYKIVETCFTDMFNCWESFLEKSFIYYLMGHENLQGKIYNCCVNPRDEKHAYNILKGTKTYPKWTEPNETSCLSDLYFDNHGPFICLEDNPIEFTEIKDIRNYISHHSEKSKQCFQKVIIRNLKVAPNITPAEYLLKMKDKQKITNFTYYAEFLKLYVDKICGL